MDNCIFCKIIKGEIPSYKIYEDENHLAFLDIEPVEEVHTLVIPKKHYQFVWDVEEIGEYFSVCQKIARHFQKVSGKEIVSSFIHGEAVPHAHIHLFPKIRGEFSEAISQLDHNKLEPGHASEIVAKFALN